MKVFVEAAIHNSFFIDRLDNAAVGTEFPNRLIYHRILLVEKGTGKLTIDNHSFAIKGQELFLMGKGQVYFFEKPAVMSGYMLSFGDCFWEKAPASASNCKAVLFNNVEASQHIPLNDTALPELAFLFKTLLHEYQQPAYTNQVDAWAAYLKIIMIKIANIRFPQEDTFDSQDYILYRSFIDLLASHYQSSHEVKDYAKMLDITPRRLSDLCKRCSQKSAKEIINERLVGEAKRSLQFSSSPVKEIAYQLNFNSPEQFSHFFKKNTSYSPASYREHFVSIGSK